MSSISDFNAELGRQQFLELFVTQLQNQDPLDPVSNEDYLGQLAQFSTVEGLENLNSSFDSLNTSFSDLLQLQLLGNGAELLGRTVTYGGAESGVVESIKQTDGEVLAQVGDHLIPISNIQTVKETPVENATSSSSPIPSTESSTNESPATDSLLDRFVETLSRAPRERE